MKRLAALAILAWSLALTLLRRMAPASRRRSGLRKFLDNYEPDGIYPIPPAVRERAPELERCILCGLCELPAILSGAGAGSSATAVDLASSLSRQLPELPALRDEAHVIAVSAEAEALCPVGMPLREIARFVLAAGEREAGLQPRIASSFDDA